VKKQEGRRNPKITYLIVGIGNPGVEYIYSRHNLGFKVIDLLSKKYNLRLYDKRFHSKSAKTGCFNKEVVLACPQTFMNNSGLAVKRLVKNYSVEMNNFMVVHDDLDLEAGRMKIVRGGGAGGHRGIKSIILHFGSSDFIRTKIGIGRPRHEELIEDFVLNPFYSDQKKTMDSVLNVAIEAIESFILNGVEFAMNNFNSMIIVKKEVEG
jgi:PTH1 family peptidyl-tRNA hydrolase